MKFEGLLSSHVNVAILVIYTILIFASVLVWMLRRRSPGASTDELVSRTRSWWWMITVFSVAILTWQWAATVLLAFVAFLALKEYLSLIPTRRVDRSILLWAYLAVPVQFYLAYLGRFGLFMTFIPVWMFLFFPARITVEGKTEGFLRAVGLLSSLIFSGGSAPM